MKYLFVFLLAQHAFYATAQSNWDPFPLGQKTWWRTGDSLRMYYRDSSEAFPGGSQLHYFGEKYIAGVFGDCFLGVWTGLLGSENTWSVPKEYLWNWTSHGDQWRVEGQTVLRTLSQPGETWTINTPGAAGFSQLKITCTTLDTLSIFGLTTAARHFSLTPLLGGLPVANSLAGQEFILTEQAGLIRFVSIHSILEGEEAAVYEVAGFVKDGQRFGLAPEWDYFFGHFAAGDRQKWLTIDQIFPFGYKIDWNLQELTAVSFNPDQLDLITAQQHLRYDDPNVGPNSDSITQFLPEVHQTIYRADWAPAWAAAPGWFAESNWPAAYTRVEAWFDSTNTLKFELQPNFVLSFADCDLQPVNDFKSIRQIDGRCGPFLQIDFYKMGEWSARLVGCESGGISWGDLDSLPTVIVAAHETQPLLSIQASPNPAGDWLRISLPEPLPDRHCTLWAVDVQGRAFCLANNFSGTQQVRVSHLPAGSYGLLLYNGNIIARGKFLKE